MTRLKRADKKPKTTLKKPPASAGFWQVFWYRFSYWGVRTNFWKKFAIVFVVTIVAAVGSMYGIAQWYINKHSTTPLVVGATFIPNYARYYDLDPEETLEAIIDDLGVKHLRLVSYWNDIEKDKGTYDYSELDWQMSMAEMKGAKVSLALGLRQPRWPECHMPAWAQEMPGNSWYEPLSDFIRTTVERYKDHPALESYQLENEYFLKVFGICYDFNRDRLVDEYNLVKRTDPDTPVTISMSNNAIGTPIGDPTPDKWAISVYKRVWDRTITLRYFEYPIPAWYYAFRAGWTELTRGRDVFMHELQTEAWLPDGYEMTDAPISELYESMSPERLEHRIRYGEATGMREMYLWGVEWWYQMKTQRNAPELWDVAKQEIQRIDQANKQLN